MMSRFTGFSSLPKSLDPRFGTYKGKGSINPLKRRVPDGAQVEQSAAEFDRLLVQGEEVQEQANTANFLVKSLGGLDYSSKFPQMIREFRQEARAAETDLNKITKLVKVNITERRAWQIDGEPPLKKPMYKKPVNEPVENEQIIAAQTSNNAPNAHGFLVSRPKPGQSKKH
jgi:hypothetical protein